MIIWPFNSSDLYSIENLWNYIKYRIWNSENPPRGITELRAAIRREWDLISHERILEYIDTMPERIRICIERNGGYTGF